MDTSPLTTEIKLSSSVDEQKYQKIGGWLYIVGIGVVLNPILYVYTIAQSVSVLSYDVWRLITTPGTEVYHPMLAPLIVFELVTTVGFLVLSIAVAIYFFQKRKILPKLIITFLLSNLAFCVIDFLWVNSITLSVSLGADYLINWVYRTAIACLIYVPYFLKSKRVKGTFVH